MATVNEVLTAMDEPGEDTRVILTIDENLRIVAVPSTAMVIGAKGDKDVNRIWFKINRNYRGTDLYGFVPKVYYTNALGQRFYYVCTDAALEGEYMLFSWLIGRNAVAETGTVSFGVCLQRGVENRVLQEFNTTTTTMRCIESACDGNAIKDEGSESGVETLGSSILGRMVLG